MFAATKITTAFSRAARSFFLRSRFCPSVLQFSSASTAAPSPSFQPGDAIQVEVMSFGPLGASVDIIADSHRETSIIQETEPPLGQGLILQREIRYFRESRNNVDVVRGEVLPGYVEFVRDDGKVNISLRAFGQKAKADEVVTMILDRLELSPRGALNVGDKSSPEEIAMEFPGISKASFKRAVAGLYKQGKVVPGTHTVTLVRKEE
jgi:hypothetical protein